MKKQKLKITSTQIYDTHNDVQEAVVEATIGERNGSYYIIFKQKDEESGVVTQNTLKVKGDTVWLKRNGGLGTDLEFNLDNPYETIYHTPYQEMEIKVETQEIIKKLEDEEINLRLKYTILMQNQKISENIYVINSCK